MANAYYSLGDERGARVRDLFSRIAGRYDLINDIQSLGLHRLWKSRLIELAQIVHGTRVLDVCSGTGDLALAMWKEGVEVTGVDFCAPMLKVASDRSSAAARGGHQVRFAQADALNLPFADNSFDVVTVGYGLRNLANLDRALAELLRVLRAGGRLCVLDFGKPESASWRVCYETYLACVVPIFGWVFVGDPAAYAYILESLKHYPGQRGVDEKLRCLGCQRTRVVNFLGGAMSLNLAETPPKSPDSSFETTLKPSFQSVSGCDSQD